MDFLKNPWKNQPDTIKEVGTAFNYIPTFDERQKFYKIRYGEWFRVSNNFWVKDKNNFEPRTYLFL